MEADSSAQARTSLKKPMVRARLKAAAEIAQSVATAPELLTPRAPFAKALRQRGCPTLFFCFDNMLSDFLGVPVDDLPEDVVSICEALDEVESNQHLYPTYELFETPSRREILSHLLLQLSQALLEAGGLI